MKCGGKGDSIQKLHFEEWKNTQSTRNRHDSELITWAEGGERLVAYAFWLMASSGSTSPLTGLVPRGRRNSRMWGSGLRSEESEWFDGSECHQMRVMSGLIVWCSAWDITCGTRNAPSLCSAALRTPATLARSGFCPWASLPPYPWGGSRVCRGNNSLQSIRMWVAILYS